MKVANIYGFLVWSFLCSYCSLHAQSRILFNGNDLSGWHIDVPKMDNDPTVKSPFLVRNGMLVSMGEPNGHIITDATYSNYRLEVEYRFAGKPHYTKCFLNPLKCK
jgi:hypothetical protein